MRKFTKLAALGYLLASMALGAPAGATVIDTTGSFGGEILAFGDPNTATFGQTFTVIGADNFLDSFSLYLWDRANGSGTLDLRGYIAGWDGAKASSILFESATQTMNAAGTLQEFVFDPNLSLVSGNSYVAFLSISNLPDQATSTFGMPIAASDVMPGGFVSLDNGQNFASLTTNNWDTVFIQYDVWFKASLTEGAANPVPEPSALMLLGAGLAGIGLAWRRPSLRFGPAG